MLIPNKLPSSCRILAVSKLQSVEKIRKLYSVGQKLFAENYVQEALVKQLELQDLEIEWHFIGRLQKNKIKQIAGKFALLHSVDSVTLAEALNKYLGAHGPSQKILLQINLANEETKAGFSEPEISSALDLISKMKSVEVCGLMTMPPLFENPEDARPFFRQLRQLRDRFQKSYPSLKELSMGTSSDYLIAVEEGSTIVRLGTVLFGERKK